MVLTKRSLFDSATAYAQGGIAAALGAGDSPELHRQDTLAAGAALCDAKAVRCSSKKDPRASVSWQTAGAHFDLEPGGNFKLGKEAAHSRRRIVHAHGDQTGAEVARTLIKRVKESERIEVLEKTREFSISSSTNGVCHRSSRGGRRKSSGDNRRRDGARDRWMRTGLPLHDKSAGRDRRRLRDRAPRRSEAGRHGVRAVPPDSARHARESTASDLGSSAWRGSGPSQRGATSGSC